jgi:hypothetical protein
MSEKTDRGLGSGRGRSRGRGRGRMGGPKSAGPGGECVCPDCGHSVTHKTGHPCSQQKCSECGAAMIREGR